MTKYKKSQKILNNRPKKWLITGVAGFIGSNLLKTLLELNQTVRGVDNFETGHKKNLSHVKNRLKGNLWKNFSFLKGDIRNLEFCKDITQNIDIVLHQAALGSVPRSLENPINTNEVNISGFLNMLVASKESPVRRFIYAASSSTYGDHPKLPKVEDIIG